MNEEHQRHALQVAEAIEAHAGQYHQGWYEHSCGTPACVAGWSVAVKARGLDGAAGFDVRSLWLESKLITDEAARNLGLSASERPAMFSARPFVGDDTRKPTAAEAATMLRRYADTGEVVWA